MAAATKRQLLVLKPFLQGDRPNGQGEWGMHCPFHEDRTRSASLNVRKGKWYCNVCRIGGSLEDLVEGVSRRMASNGTNGHRQVAEIEFNDEEKEAYLRDRGDLEEAMVSSFHRALLGRHNALEEFSLRRGLDLDTIKRFQIGWDVRHRAYTIPVRDREGELVNIRRYVLDPPEGRRKIWGVEGHNDPVLFPLISLLDESEVVICEGELDALMLIQYGFNGITRTGAAEVWNPSWNHLFDDKLVFVCHDMDETGQRANRRVMRELRDHAREIREIVLPYDVKENHGKDITDYFFDYQPQDFKDLMNEALSIFRDPEIIEREYVDVGVLDSFSSDSAGQRLRMKVTITGKRTPPFLLPSDVAYFCTQDAGVKCQTCVMNTMGGSARRTVDSHDPRILEMMGSSNTQVEDILRKILGAMKCPKLTIEPKQFRAVEELFVRPSVDLESTSTGDFTNRKIVSVGRHDSLPNNTVEVVGSIFPNPRGQHNEFQAWEVTKTETSIDRYVLTEHGYETMLAFVPTPSQRPLAKLGDISRDISEHVTKIYGRREMHALMDLTYHSVISFELAGRLETRGWLDVLVVGDTRTGKSEAAQRLLDFYGLGQMISCESASFAGIVGGLQQVGSGKEWEITWGAIPINDRRLVVLDEISGLLTEQIAQMSSIRSSGVAELTKIRSERTYARTRLLWLGNPRNGRMSDYTYGVQAIRPLVGNNEDVARFDLAMSVKAEEVDPEEINRTHNTLGDQQYTQEACRELLHWVWSRKPDQVVFEDKAVEAIYAAALALGDRYVENPPLVQAANARVKVARIAAALAARTFSHDPADPERLIVKKVHVEDAVKFIDLLYKMPGFGYREVSQEEIEDRREAIRKRDDAKGYLVSSGGLAKFLRSVGHFRRQDLEDMLNLSKEEANAIIGTLWKFRLIVRQGANIRLTPMLQELLREIK